VSELGKRDRRRDGAASSLGEHHPAAAESYADAQSDINRDGYSGSGVLVVAGCFSHSIRVAFSYLCLSRVRRNANSSLTGHHQVIAEGASSREPESVASSRELRPPQATVLPTKDRRIEEGARLLTRGLQLRLQRRLGSMNSRQIIQDRQITFLVFNQGSAGLDPIAAVVISDPADFADGSAVDVAA